MITADGSRPQAGVWDAIAVHAATPEFPVDLASSLADKGLMVLPLKRDGTDMLTRVRRTGDEFEQEEISACRFVPLITSSGR